jgi:hypothetical protein
MCSRTSAQAVAWAARSACATAASPVARQALPRATARLRRQRRSSRCGGWHCPRCAAGSRPRSRPTVAAAWHGRRPCAFVEVGQRAALRVLVPGAGELAVVAAVDAVADGGRSARDRAGMFDGQVADAAPRVQPVGRHDGLRGADLDAGAAAAAMALAGASSGRPGPRRSRPGRTSSRPRVQQPACACRASPGRRAGQFHLQHRRRVGEDAVAEGAHLLGQPVGQLLQARRSTL